MTKKMKSFLILASMVFILIPKKGYSQLQCNYSINNGTQCNVSVKVEFFDSCPGTPCYSQTQTCAPGATWFNCVGCGTLCDIQVTFSGTYVVNVGTTTNSGTACGTSGCTPTNAVDINWFTWKTDYACAP
jgi:hypothetical protein